LAHDLDGGAFCLACNTLAAASSSQSSVRTNIEMERIGGGSLCDDAKTNTDLLVWLRLTLLEMRVVADIVGDLVVDMELVRVWVRLLGGSECVDLVGADLKVLLGHVSRLLLQ
jgi:hypothetical protein